MAAATSRPLGLHDGKEKGVEKKNKQKNKGRSAKIMLEPLTNFTRTQDAHLDAWGLSIAMVGQDIWVCGTGGIQVLNNELVTLLLVPCGDMGYIRGCADTGSSVVVAAKEGLFLLNYQGEEIDIIQSHSYRDVYYSSGQIYAITYDEPHSIEVYLKDAGSEIWRHGHTVLVQCPGNENGDHVHTVTVHNQEIYMACYCYNRVSKYDRDGNVLYLNSGEEISDIGDFKGPRLCHTQNSSAVLVADTKNQRIQILCDDGKWHELLLEPPPEDPRDALLTTNALFILGSVSFNTSNIIKYVYE